MVVMPHPCTFGWPGSRVANEFDLMGRLVEMGSLLGRQSLSYDIVLKHIEELSYLIKSTTTRVRSRKPFISTSCSY
ncbi:hypothetical protein LXL04_008084 [Taraxacum kok-saghyz]